MHAKFCKCKTCSKNWLINLVTLPTAALFNSVKIEWSTYSDGWSLIYHIFSCEKTTMTQASFFAFSFKLEFVYSLIFPFAVLLDLCSPFQPPSFLFSTLVYFCSLYFFLFPLVLFEQMIQLLMSELTANCLPVVITTLSFKKEFSRLKALRC